MRKNKRSMHIIPTWHTVYTTGKPLFMEVQSLAMTSGADSAIYTVPQGERWVIIDAYLQNNSGQTIACNIQCSDGSDQLLTGYIAYNGTLADGAQLCAFSEKASARQTAQPSLLFEGYKLKFTWGAHGSKSGNSVYYATVLRFKVGKY